MCHVFPCVSRNVCGGLISFSALSSGLWDDLAPRLSSCGTLYFMCTPSPPVVNVAPLEERGVKRRKRRHETQTTAAPDEGVPAEPACAVAVDGGPNEEGGCSGEDDELPGVIVDEATDGLPQRVPTVTVPVSISNCAPSPERLHQLLALSDVEAGAPVSLALVDSDCTVIVSNIYRGMVPPPVLDTVAGEDEEEEEIPAVLEENVAGVPGDAAVEDADADADALLDTAVVDVMT